MFYLIKCTADHGELLKIGSNFKNIYIMNGMLLDLFFIWINYIEPYIFNEPINKVLGIYQIGVKVNTPI